VLTNAHVLRGLAEVALAYALAGAAVGLYFAAPGGGDWPGAIVFGVALMEGAWVIARRFAVVVPAAVTGAALWWLAMLLSATVRAHPHWAFAAVALSAFVTWRRVGEIEALATGLAACLAIFVVTIGTYVLLPSLAPEVVPGTEPGAQSMNQETAVVACLKIMLAAGLIGFAVGAKRRLDRLPG
jgi:hypothetical protein